MFLLVLVLLLAVFCSLIEMGWIDPDTTLEKQTISSHNTPGRDFTLVFSDEFNTDQRYFHDGYDPKWTSLQKDDYTNYALQFYNSSLAKTKDGYLTLQTIIEDIEYLVRDVTHTPPVYKNSKQYQSAMVQGWNKFCYTGGIIEISAKLPGKSKIGGLWPAMWLLGNLARATYVGSSNNIWPWSYDTCNQRIREQQLISACNTVNHFDLNKRQGRGAPEIDILEAMAGNEKLPNTNITKPYYSASLQVAPGSEGYRPNAAERPVEELWYNHSLAYGENTSLNIFFYGNYLEGDIPKHSYRADALSANHDLLPTHFNDQHVYRLEWEPGPNGFIAWYLDDVFVYQIDAPALSLTKAIMPEEPMYIVFNTAMSSTWGFPTPCPEGCPCNCFDCRKQECLCAVPSEMCHNFPAEFLIDYVRVYQDPSNVGHTVGCSTPSHPTKTFIKAHPHMYKSEEDSVPLQPVQRGGGKCRSNEDCGHGGLCKRKQCRCVDRNYTGPHCQAAAGFNDIELDPDEEFDFYGVEIPFSLTIMVLTLALGFLCIGIVRYYQVKQHRDYQLLIDPYAALVSDPLHPSQVHGSLDEVEEETGGNLRSNANRIQSYQNS